MLLRVLCTHQWLSRGSNHSPVEVAAGHQAADETVPDERILKPAEFALLRLIVEFRHKLIH